MLTIGDIVTVDQQAEFRNDVQLDAFDKPQQNLGLLRSYLFSSATPQGKTAGLRSTSSVDLLNEVVEVFLNSSLENRLVAIANYGHGKSHLALALANYFSRPFASQEVQTILDKLGKALNDPARAARFRDFKESRGEFLVVRLRGEEPRSLREQFLMGLERALSEHEATRDVAMPFWHRLAEKALNDLNADDRRRANAFLLETHHLDVAQLVDRIQKRRDVYQLCVQLFTHLHNGMPPNLGGAVSLRDAVDWATRTFCTNGPMGGLLILFDEFSFHVQRFAHRTTGDLQDLLNGVDNHQGKVAFLAFGQHDPLAVADSTPMQGIVRESLKHELGRLPQKQKHVLYSLMESVIDAYLNQDTEAWKTLKQDSKVDTKLFVASTTAMDCFEERYQRQLRWSHDQFQRTVTTGCFPLHPLTTAFLCNVKLQTASDVGTPRTVLGFVFEELKARQDQPALIDGRINWVLPVELVDYFESRLASEDQYRVYESARRAIGLSAPQDQQALLKALLLQEIAGVKAKGEDQVKLIAQFAGLDRESAQAGLTALVAAKGIRYDQLDKAYSFRSADGISQGDLERIVERQLERLPFDAAALAEMTKRLSALAGNASFGAIPIDVSWGEKTDWAAKEIILTREFCTVDHLRAVLRPYHYTAQGLQEDQRGAVVWLLARDEDDVSWYRETINPTIDAAYPGDAPPPMLCVIVAEALPELVDAFQSWRALKGLRDEDRKKIGAETFNDEIERAEAVMHEALARLRGHETRALDWGRPASSYGVPLAYRARINGLAAPSVRTVLTECYRLAYRSAPPGFLTQYQADSPKLRNATKATAKQLIRGSVANLRQGPGVDPIARDICAKVLYPEWRLLAPDSRVQEPGERRVRQAWDLLDQTFAPGKPETLVREVIVTLLNAPYGYDPNTATLLFSAWFGWRAHDLSIFALGRLARRDSVDVWLDRGPKGFLALMCEEQKVALTRAEPGAAARRIQQLIERTKTETFTLDQAHTLRTELRNYCGDDTQEEAKREAARKAVEALEDAIERADEYERDAQAITLALGAERDLEKLIGLQKRIEQLPHLSNVITAVAQPAALRAQLTDRVAQLVDDHCQANVNLQQRTQLDLRQSNLDKIEALLRRTGSLDLLKKIDDARGQLDRRAKELERQEREAETAGIIQAMDSNARLKKLYEYRDQLQTWSRLSGPNAQARDERLAEITRRIKML